MTEKLSSPWNERFREISRGEIAERQSCRPQTLDRSEFDNDSDFLGALKTRFEELFVPTKQTIEHAQQLFDVCSSYAAVAYKDSRDFLRQCYAQNGPVRIGEVLPYCLTGPAGVGKTSFLKRMVETLPEPTSICIDSGSRAFPLKSVWYLSIEEMTSITQMLRTLITNNGAEPDGKSISSLLQQCRRLAYQSGVCLLILDELQALTQSSTASALVAKTLLEFRRIGIPLVYCANYSLVHRLKGRPHQDIERLLSEPMILIQDSAESSDWNNTVRGFVGIAPSVFKISSSEDATTLHTWTAGSKRLLSFLMRQAAKAALKRGKTVGLTELQSAYESTTFSINRKNVEIMNLQFATGRKERADLWCPFDLPKLEKATLKQTTIDMNVQRMTEEMIYDSMSPGQKQMYLDILAANADPEDPKVVPIGKNATPSIEDFERGEAILKDLK